MTEVLKINVPGKAEYVGTVRLATAHVASYAGFDIDTVEDIKVAISEACTNIICHAHENPNFVYDVVLEVGGNVLTITVKDDGAGFGIEEYVTPVLGELQVGGLGIFIIRALMDEVDIQSEPGTGTNIRMTKHLQSIAV
ncbi:MAG: ATP-binding protein [Clostridiales bacterium]|nr:ATP-binding protein [Clostridiales bacterium]